MYLKNYQIRVVNELKNFFQTSKAQKTAFDAAAAVLPEDMRDSLNYVQKTFEKFSFPYNDSSKNGLGKFYPRIVMKVPTGGGKTLLAVEAIREYQNNFAQKKTGLVVWIVPREPIYKQTLNRLRDKGDPYRQLLDQASGGRTLIVEKGQKLSLQDIEENLVVLFVMIQSISRANTAEALKVFKDSGGYDGFFPQDNRYDLHAEWLKQVPNLDTLWNNGDQAQLVTSLGNAVRVSKPFIIIDEIHKVFSDTARKTIDKLNPEMVLGLTATPKEGMNIITKVTGLELKDEEMVKLDLHIIPPVDASTEDWKAMLNQIKEQREHLEVKAIEFRRNTGQYIRPISLIQVERTGNDQRGRGFVHSLDAKEHLLDLGVNSDEIAIKSSSQNDIEDIDLLSPDCPIRFIITKEALSEGWDCPFAYSLGIIPNTASNTGVTQLVGRILRQPRGKKTGIKELDESYVYYSKGDNGSLLNKVIAGFKEEGLEDLTGKVQVQGNATVNPPKKVEIKEEFRDYQYAFYLPVWLMVNRENDSKRRFSYDFDIRPYLSFEEYNISQELLQKITESLSEENKEQKSFTVTIDQQSHAQYSEESRGVISKSFISKNYLSRRISEIVDNPFLARKICNAVIDNLIEEISEEKLSDHFSYITAKIVEDLSNQRKLQEEEIFMKHLNEETLELVITDDSINGFQIPKEDIITITGLPNTYTKNLYSDVEVSSMNSLEKSVAGILENQQKLLWWFRNKVGKNWYSIQGWHKHKIRPDFVVAKKKEDNSVDIIYILESKGEHLVNNPDTVYKKKVFDKMTELHQNGKIKSYQTELDFGQICEEQAAYLIEGSQEDTEIRRLFM